MLTARYSNHRRSCRCLAFIFFTPLVTCWSLHTFLPCAACSSGYILPLLPSHCFRFFLSCSVRVSNTFKREYSSCSVSFHNYPNISILLCVCRVLPEFTYIALIISSLNPGTPEPYPIQISSKSSYHIVRPRAAEY
jgi:hypothetical protein